MNAEITTIDAPDAALILVNDGDLTYAKLRPDATSMTALTNHLGDVDDSLARSLLWGTAWDQTRDAEASASWFLELILEHVAKETDSSVVFQLLRQAATALEQFTPSSQTALYRQHFATRLWQLVLEAEPGSDVQLQLIQAFVRHAREDHVSQVSDLAQKRGPKGFSVSTDMAWSALQRLVAMDRAGEAEITEALEHDDTSSGYLAALQARAMIPTPEAKAATWQQLTSGEPTNLELRHIVMGFTDTHDLHLLEPYAVKYFETINDLWAASSYETAETLALGLFPMWAVSEDIADLAHAAIDSTPHTGLKRILTELYDDVRRALAAQEAF